MKKIKKIRMQIIKNKIKGDIMYYFVSTTNFDKQTLYPRIPHSRMLNEDDKTERICVSKSIDNCLVSVGFVCGLDGFLANFLPIDVVSVVMNVQQVFIFRFSLICLWIYLQQ